MGSGAHDRREARVVEGLDARGVRHGDVETLRGIQRARQHRPERDDGGTRSATHDLEPPRGDVARLVVQRLRDDLTGCIGCGCLSLTSCRLYNPGDAASANGSGPRFLLGDDPDLFAEAPR